LLELICLAESTSSMSFAIFGLLLFLATVQLENLFDLMALVIFSS
jgi:hypothetical protein